MKLRTVAPCCGVTSVRRASRPAIRVASTRKQKRGFHMEHRLRAARERGTSAAVQPTMNPTRTHLAVTVRLCQLAQVRAARTAAAIRARLAVAAVATIAASGCIDAQLSDYGNATAELEVLTTAAPLVFCPTLAAVERDSGLPHDLSAAATWLTVSGFGEVLTADAGHESCTVKIRFGDEDDFIRKPRQLAYAIKRADGSRGITLREAEWDRTVRDGYNVDVLAHEMGHHVTNDYGHTDSGIMAARLGPEPVIEGSR